MSGYAKLEEFFSGLSKDDQERFLKALLDSLYILDKAGKEKEKKKLFQVFDYLYRTYNQKKKLEAEQKKLID